ncbi:ATP-binding protein [Streptomyces harbinensis]|uniref:ATP-binding protein n=1 Tax=Streptomyces harbinensis TaxID=1176198 RepID=UPI003635F57B
MAVVPDPIPALRQDRLSYNPVPGSVRRARRRAPPLVGEWGCPRLAQDAALVVCELASNALLHGGVPGRAFRVHLMLLPAVLRVEVTDALGERLPVVRPVVGEPTCGRGLLLIAALTARWGVTPLVVGKTVWAEFDLEEGEGSGTGYVVRPA